MQRLDRLQGWGLAMHLDPVAIADALAAIASRTQEPETARQLMELIDHLLTAAGLPPEDHPAGHLAAWSANHEVPLSRSFLMRSEMLIIH